MKDDRPYGVRYFVQEWNKPRELVNEVEVMPGLVVNGSDFGFADAVFLASMLKDEMGNITSILLLDNETGVPTRKMLLEVRAAIDHQLEYHTGE